MILFRALRGLCVPLWVFACAGLLAPPARAESVSVGLRAAILLRSLGYERGVAQGRGPLLIAVVFGTEGPSEADAREMAAAFHELAMRMKIGRRSIAVQSVEHRATRDTQARLRSLSPAAVYFGKGLEGVSLELAAGTGAGGWVAMCADGEKLGTGCVVGVRVRPTSSQLVVHLERAQRAGLSFDPRMLRISHVLP